MLVKIFLKALTHLASLLMRFPWIGLHLYPLSFLLSLHSSALLNHWATTTVLWVPTTLGLCCARLIDFSMAVDGVKGSWLRAFHCTCDDAYGMSYDAFVTGLIARREDIMAKMGTRPYLMSSRRLPRTAFLATTESTVAVFGSSRSEFTAQTMVDDAGMKSAVKVDYPTPIPSVVQTLSGTDSTMAAGRATDVVSPIPLSKRAPAEAESTVVVLDSAAVSKRETGPASVKRPGVRTVRFADPCHEVACSNKTPSRDSAFLETHIGTEASTEFDAFIESVSRPVPEPDIEPERFTLCAIEYMATKVPGYTQREAAGPSIMVYPDPSTITFGSKGFKRQNGHGSGSVAPATTRRSFSGAPTGSTSNPGAPEIAPTTRPASNLPLDQANTSGSSDDLFEFDDDVNFSHRLSVLFSAEACAKVDAAMRELLADLSEEEDELQ